MDRLDRIDEIYDRLDELYVKLYRTTNSEQERKLRYEIDCLETRLARLIRKG